MADSLYLSLWFPSFTEREMMPRALRLFAQLLPTTFAARAVQTTLAGGHDVGRELIALSLMACVTLALGFHLMKWRED